jgi:hypothetical protein
MPKAVATDRETDQAPADRIIQPRDCAVAHGLVAPIDPNSGARIPGQQGGPMFVKVGEHVGLEEIRHYPSDHFESDLKSSE